MGSLERISMLDYDPATMPLEDIDVSDVDLWINDAKWDYLTRLRNDAPVHYCKSSEFGPYWSITRFDDIMKVEKTGKCFRLFHPLQFQIQQKTAILLRRRLLRWTRRNMTISAELCKML